MGDNEIELLKRIEALEARIAKLEESSSTSSQKKNGLTGTVTLSYPEVIYGNTYVDTYLRWFVRLTNGKMGYLSTIRTSDCNYTVGQTRKVADMFGYKYDSKTKREMLGFELVSKYGDGEWAFIAKNAVDANGVTYDFIETTLPYDPNFLKFATGQTKRTKRSQDESKSDLETFYTNKPLVVDSKWTADEIAAKLLDFYNSLVKK